MPVMKYAVLLLYFTFTLFLRSKWIVFHLKVNLQTTAMFAPQMWADFWQNSHKNTDYKSWQDNFIKCRNSLKQPSVSTLVFKFCKCNTLFVLTIFFSEFIPECKKLQCLASHIDEDSIEQFFLALTRNLKVH